MELSGKCCITLGRELILACLRQYNWNIKSARKSLGLPKKTFHRYTRALGIAGSVREDLTGIEQLSYQPKASHLGEVPALIPNTS